MSAVVPKSFVEGRAKGAARMKQLSAEYAQQRRELTAELLAALGRVPSALDKIWATNLAALHCRAIRLEAQGKDSSATRRLINISLKSGGLKPAPAVPAGEREESLESYLTRTAAEAST